MRLKWKLRDQEKSNAAEIRSRLIGPLFSALIGLGLLGLQGCGMGSVRPLSEMNVPTHDGLTGEVTPVADIVAPSGTPSTSTDVTEAEPVYVQGQVVAVVPLVESSLYQVQDETGLIWVLTTAIAPELGDRVKVKGTVAFESVPIAGEELGEHYIAELAREEQR